VCGLMLGSIGVRALLAINPGNIPRIGASIMGEGDALILPIDWRVFAFTAIASIVTGLVFGVLPAFHAARVDLLSVMKQGGGGRAGAGGGARARTTRSILVVAEMTFAVALLIGAALLIRSFVAMSGVDPGFDRSHVLTLRMSMKDARFTTTAGLAQAIEDGVQRVRAVPGVVEASAAYCLPLQGYLNLRFTIIGRPTTKGPYHDFASLGLISPGYFDVFRIPLRRGRLFDERDAAAGSPPVIIISEALARTFFPDPADDPLRHQLILGRGLGQPFESEPARQIVGIVGDVHDYELTRAPQPTMYLPQAQLSDGLNATFARLSFTTWAVRTRVAPAMLAHSIEEALRDATHGVPVSHVRSMEDVSAASAARPRFNTVVLTIFGGVALLLAAIGIYGLMAYAVQQRTREIGIRIALGADTRRVRLMIVRQGMRVALAGIAIGVLASYLLTRVLSDLLFGVDARDAAVFVAVPLLLASVAFVAVWFPGRTACRVDPVVALRSE
jgi:putative ABC transport system permease protein